MKTIKEYLNQVEKVIITLHQDKSLVEEYESHLMAQFDDFLAENPTNRKKELESRFVAQLEDPDVIADSLIEKEFDIERKKIFPFQLGRFKFISTLNKYYNANPLTTAIVTLIFLIGSSFSVLWISSFLIWPLFPEETLFRYLAAYFLILLIVVAFFYLGLKKSFSEIVITSLLFTILLISLLMLIRWPDKLYIIVDRYRDVNHYSYDWTMIGVPDLLEYLIYLLSIVITQFLNYTAFIIIIASFGYLIKLIMTKSLFINSKKFQWSSLYKIVLISLCITVYFLIPDTSYRIPRFFMNSYANTPPPDPLRSPLFYIITIEPGTSTYERIFPGPEPFITKVKEFGNFSCEEHALYTVSFTQNDFSRINSSYTASFSPVYPGEGRTSEFQFPILGSLFLQPESIPIKNPEVLNSSFPFEGFEPTQNIDVKMIEWGDLRVGKTPVITVKYSSKINDYFYTFHFDERTGWLMQATLSRIDGSWYDDYDGYEQLVLKRIFLEETFNQISDYRFLEMIFSLSILIITSCVLVYSYHYYKKKG
ncbi:MAG: hypothetical protein ACFE98_19475 [Candidatus Hermodarchaeota archaeon]